MTIYAIVDPGNLVKRYEEMTDPDVPGLDVDEAYHVVSAVVDLTSRPTPFHELTYTGGTTTAWVDGRSLAEAQALKWEQKKDQRDIDERATIVWMGSTFDCDDASWMRVLEASVQALFAQFWNQSYSRTWILSNNSTREMDKADILSLANSMANRREMLFDASYAARNAIMAATTVAQVDAIP